MIKMRLRGLKPDLEKALERLQTVCKVLSISKFYADRNSEYFRVYLEVDWKRD